MIAQKVNPLGKLTIKVLILTHIPNLSLHKSLSIPPWRGLQGLESEEQTHKNIEEVFLKNSMPQKENDHAHCPAPFES